MSTAEMMGPQAPARSLEQRMQSLERANAIRIRRARMKREIKAGRLSVASVLRDPPVEAETMKIIDLLLATPKCGRVKANRVLAVCRVSPAKSLSGLTVRQREELIGRLRERGWA